jgi:hypothetical protein
MCSECRATTGAASSMPGNFHSMQLDPQLVYETSLPELFR